jgi:hypothetical protein
VIGAESRRLCPERIYSPLNSNQTRRERVRPNTRRFMKYQHRVLGMLSLLAVITYLDRVCIAVAGPHMQDGSSR